jgi:hypothetical protein
VAGKAKYDWPPIEGLVEYVRKHGVREASNRMGVPHATLRSHLANSGVTAEDWRTQNTIQEDALREIHALVR